MVEPVQLLKARLIVLVLDITVEITVKVKIILNEAIFDLTIIIMMAMNLECMMPMKTMS